MEDEPREPGDATIGEEAAGIGLSTTRAGLLSAAGGAMLFGLPGRHPRPKRRRRARRPAARKPTTPPAPPQAPPPPPPAASPPVTAPVVAPPVVPIDPTNPIPAENLKPGDARWAGLPGYTSDNSGQYIGAFATAVSVAQGASLELKVRVPGGQPYAVDVFRLGWYGGLGGCFVTRLDGQQAPSQPAAVASQPASGRIQDTAVHCDWRVSSTLAVGADWVSGVYVAIVSTIANGGHQSTVPFLVRADVRPAPLLYLAAMTNYQAYNNYPDDGPVPSIGRSLYDSNSGYAPGTTVRRSAARVSFDRPWARGNGIAQLFDYEAPLIQFLERFGYDVSYAADLDLDQRGEAQRHRAILVAGHSEYWSRGMFESLVAARDAGTSVACFSSNALYWQVRFEDDRRTVVGYKNSDNRGYTPASLNRTDPVADASRGARWRDLGTPEAGLLGVQYVTNSWCDPRIVGYPLVPKDTGHWAFEETGLQAGVAIPGDLAGYEIDTYTAPGGQPAIVRPVGAAEFATLMESPFTGNDTNRYTQHSVLYEAPSGALVFATGSMGWALGLTPNAGLRGGNRNFESQGLQRLTGNVLGRMLAP